MDDAYLKPLNPEQREAVLHTGKPLLILAGAGSGKTRVITTKIAYLIREQGLDPRSILAVTFTNKAAREMAERARLIDGRAQFAMLRTFHSFGAWFLRRYSDLAGLESGFTIYDDADTLALLSLIREKGSRGEIKSYAHNIARAKDYFLNPEDSDLSLIDYRKDFRRVYQEYEERLGQIGNVDFGDLIKKPVEVLRNNPKFAERFRERFRAVLVDEYQDANIAQFELLRELCGPETYLCVVGDDDQSIYRFRGAEVRNILEFPDRFAGTEVIRLERNYRSVAPILGVASSVIARNRGRLGKTLIPERGKGKQPVWTFLPNQEEEVNFCAELIESSVKKNFSHTEKSSDPKYADWAVLYRTNAQSLGFETEFLRRRIPYRVVGSLKFYEREEIKDALALLAIVANPKDEVAFRRVVNKPARGVGPAAAARIVSEAQASDGNLLTAARRLAPELSAKAKSGLTNFLKAIKSGQAFLGISVSTQLVIELTAEALEQTEKKPKKQERKPKNTSTENQKREHLQSGEGLSGCVITLIENTGIAEYHLDHDEIAGNQRFNNLQELANAASLYPASETGLTLFLEHIELDRSLDDDKNTDEARDAVTLITFHNTKGLEFKRVIMTGLEQGVFPRKEEIGEELEDERRLFYVGATRAMDELYLCSTALRRLYGRTEPMQPSQFFYEINRNYLRTIGDEPQDPEDFDVGWEIGNRLFHEEQGYGSVIDIQEADAVLRVRFDTGKEMRFSGQDRRLTRINEE
ncbi:MAG: ATP-dependent helicase [Spirochaetaceae bacterium]|jgi:DNA helicase-2/ATP-dependent DNA helicase PcrA|nr:ATP-dependent helicase [Spirochaetaceae bacterium]